MKNYKYIILFALGLSASIYYNGMNSSLAKYIAMGCLCLLTIISLFKIDKITKKVFAPILKWFGLTCVVNAIYYYIFDRNVDVFNLEILQPLIVMFSSYCLFDCKKEKLYLFFLPICIFSAFCGVQTILQGLGAFRVFEYGEAELAKNQIGAAFTIVAIVSGVFAMDKLKWWIRIIFVVLSIVNMYPAVFLGCRTAMLCYIIVIAILIFQSYGKKALVLIPVIVGLIVILGGSSLQNLLYDSIVGRRDINDADSMTSGRLVHFTQSLDYFLSHPLLGFYGSGDSYGVMPPNAHIFVLFRLTKWGMVGAIPFLALYLYFFKWLVWSMKRNNILLSGILSFAYVESLSEYAPPFGPGSSFILLFFIIGIFLKQNKGQQKI